MGGHKFDIKKDIPDLSGKVFLVTGGNSGLGEATVTALAQHNPGKIYLAARSQTKADEAITRIRQTSKAAESANIEIIILELSSLESVKTAATKINASTDRLDQIQLNGGIAAMKHAVSTDGYELTMATNYLGHALLTQLLMPKLLATAKMPSADVRIVVMSSVGHKHFPMKPNGIEINQLTTPMTEANTAALYGQSNIARTLFALKLATKYPGITSTSVHPGTVKTGIWGKANDMHWAIMRFVVEPLVYLTGITPNQGALSQLWCGFADSKSIENGAYYEPIGQRADGKWTRDQDLADRLWDWTDGELKKFGGERWVDA